MNLAIDQANVPGARKAAMFLMGLGDELSAELLRQLDPEEIRRITDEITAVDAVAPEHMLGVFREFETLSSSSRFFAKGGSNLARKMIVQALGPERAQKYLGPPPPPPEPEGADLRLLQNTSPQQLATFLSNENPQTIALVLANLPPGPAGGLMGALPAELRPQVAMRMASLEHISPEVFRHITEALGAKLKAVRQVSRSDGIKSLAGLLNQMDPSIAETVLAAIEEENQVLAGTIRDVMFVFDDIITLDKESMKAILAKVERKLLTTALKGTTPAIRDHFTQCMSQRAAEMMVEDMDALGPVRIRDVKAAQAALVAVVRQLQQEGVVAGKKGGGDEYVV
ncbi:MAG TPA: flagellar motor switch protein FliG [Verrucomicrobiae bacterium]|nr:flagellar motor switch protein FliG [Verrucomicrobiae bacterium]